jgi:hypothetical protein
MAAAHLIAQQLGLTIPTLVDGMDNAANEHFAAWPERIYIIDTGGRIAFQGNPGPAGFIVSEAVTALQKLHQS